MTINHSQALQPPQRRLQRQMGEFAAVGAHSLAVDDNHHILSPRRPCLNKFGKHIHFCML